jgi:hypothetical protein
VSASFFASLASWSFRWARAGVVLRLLGLLSRRYREPAPAPRLSWLALRRVKTIKASIVLFGKR